MEVCYLPAEPLVSCGEGGVRGIAVDYARAKLYGLGAYAETCLPGGVYAAAARGCHVIIGSLNTYTITRDFGVALANYTVGNPYAATRTSVLFADENPGPPMFFFFEPFAWGTWLLVFASFMLAGLTIRLLRGGRGPKTPPLRDAALAMAGYARLFEAEGSTFWEDFVSAATVVFSVVVVSIYSSNMVARGYIATQTIPDFYAKPLVYAIGGPKKWYVDLRSGYDVHGVDLFDARGRLNASVLDAVARGEYCAIVDDVHLSVACDRRGSVSSTTMLGVRSSFLPAVLTENVSAGVFRAFVVDSVADSFYVGGKRSCLEGNLNGVEGFTFLETWTGFAILGGVVAVLVAWKIAAYRIAVRRGLLPRDADVISERRIVPDDAPSPNSKTPSVKTARTEPHTDLEAAA